MVQSLNGTRGKFLRVGHARVLLVSSNICFQSKDCRLGMPARTKISFHFDQRGVYYRFPRLKSQ